MIARLFSPLVALAVALTTTAATAAPPAFRGEVSRISDSDTLVVKRRDGSEVKVRLRWVDGPEIAHNRRQVDQPGGVEASAWTAKHTLGKQVLVTPCDMSYGRYVGSVILEDDPTFDVGYELTLAGHAQLDPRYRPPKVYRDAEADAKQSDRGLWAADGEPLPPWEWRRLSRDEQRRRRR